MNIINENPFRILGVFANSPRRDIVSNKGKIAAFLKVGKNVSFPLDLEGLLGPLNRSEQSVTTAESHLTLAKEQLKYAQYWFLKLTPIDDIAFNHLFAGDLKQAMEIWEKKDSLSSLQNRMVVYLAMGQKFEACSMAEKLYREYSDDYLKAVGVSDTLSMTSEELSNQFIDTLGEEIGMIALLPHVSDSKWRSYIASQAATPLIRKISGEIEQAKKIDHKDAAARYRAGESLMKNTQEALSHLKAIMSPSDVQYQVIADKLGIEILQCGIDFFNNSTEFGRHKRAMELQKYAQSIVVGKLAKQRCDENVNILQGLIDKLPPEETANEYLHIQILIAQFRIKPNDVDVVLDFLNDTCSALVSIKEKLGKDHVFYVQQATLVAQIALSKSIDALNRIQAKEYPKLKGLDRETAIKRISHAFEYTWKALLWIELIETDEDFKNNRLKPNKESLKNILNQVDAFEDKFFIKKLGGSYSVFSGCACNVSVDKYTYYTDEELYSVCDTIPLCKLYLVKYPNGKHVFDIRKKISLLEEETKFRSSKTIDDFNSYLQVYPNGRFVNEAKKKMQLLIEEERKRIEREINELSYDIERCQKVIDCSLLVEKCRKYNNKALITMLDNKFFSLCRHIDDYELYISKMGNDAMHKEEASIIIRNSKKKAHIIFVIRIAILVLAVSIIGWIIYSAKERAKQERCELIQSNYEKLLIQKNPDACIQFLEDYPDCGKAIKDSVRILFETTLLSKADSLIENYNGDIDKLHDFIAAYRDVYILNPDDAIEKVADEIDEARKRKKEKEEFDKYGTDDNAWNTATSINSIDAYRDYLQRYPNGKHKKEANKKIIDLEVQSIINSGDYGELPPSQRTSYGSGGSNTITIRSRCDRTITILYSGRESLRIDIAPYGTRSIVLPSGNYKVVAKASGVRSFYGNENLTGGTYESEYYIQTVRY